MEAKVAALFEEIKAKDEHEAEFLQAVHEVLFSLTPVFEMDEKYLSVFRRLVEPERMVIFRVAWLDDAGKIQVNRGFRLQYNSAIGPYKGGLRFHPSVKLSILKFLAFEQVFKNSLTTLMMGGGKGGSDFDPKGKSDTEVMRFCQSFMTELCRHINADRDVPAGDIGVGGREIGYLFGQYKRIKAEFVGVLTGKSPKWGGSLIRPEATGYGAVYFAQEMLKHKGDDLKGKRCVVSGAGNVAQYATEKILDLGGIPITMSDSAGYIVEPEGFTREQLAALMHLKNVKRGRVSEYLETSSTAKYHAGKRPWAEPCDCAFPSATQNEIDVADAEALVAGGCKLVSEGANMPSTPGAIGVYFEKGIFYGPGKAANAGGVAVSGLEMAQDSSRIQWSREEVDAKLHSIMKEIFRQCVEAAEKVGKPDNLQVGANVAGFLKVADSMIEQGCV